MQGSRDRASEKNLKEPNQAGKPNCNVNSVQSSKTQKGRNKELKMETQVEKGTQQAPK